MQYKFNFFLLFLFVSQFAFAQPENRAIALLDLTERNNDTNEARLISSKHVLEVVGITHEVTKQIEDAFEYSMIFCSSLINKNTFTEAEEALLIDYVSLGGILVAPRIENDQLFELFGLEGYEESKSRYEIQWDLSQNSESMLWINEAEEETISLGNSTNLEIFKTLGYITSTAETLASFEDGNAAITQNVFGQGKAVTLGVSWKDVILRNQINRDYEAQRITSNGFEPTSDVLMLFIRGLFIDNIPNAVWKNTSPRNSKATLMITHDIDSNTGMDSLNIFVDFEKSKSIEATYNVTVKYFQDALSSSFYEDHQTELEYILDNGHQIQSHSVGHFFDFADDNVVLKGESGNTKSNYNPYNDGDLTTGATVYAECEVSKKVLEADFNINIRTFRAGHLAYPKDLIEVLDELGYEYNTTYSASDVLTNFPYQNVFGQSFTQPLSTVYEIPVTISDVFQDDQISSDNYLEKAAIWKNVTLKNLDNGAPTTLLIHPNRTYKLEALKFYIESIKEEKIEIMEIGNYGDFWKSRKAHSYNSTITDNILTITFPASQIEDGDISLIVKDGMDLDEIVLQNSNNELIDFTLEPWEENDLLILLSENPTNTTSQTIYSNDVNIFPNPTSGVINILCEGKTTTKFNLSIVDINGKTILTKSHRNGNNSDNEISLNLDQIDIPNGIYFLILENSEGGIQS